MISSIIDQLLQAPAWLVYLTVGLVVFVEDAFFLGFVLPGETLAILGGVTASFGHTNLWVVLPLVVVAAIVGDSVGYEVGRRLGPRLLELGPLRHRRVAVDKASETIARRGGPAVFLGRWTAFLRAVTPALSGMARMHYGTFLRWNALGGIAWGSAVVVAGYLAGHSYQRVEHWLGAGAGVVVAVVVVVAVGVHLVRRRRERTREELAG